MIAKVEIDISTIRTLFGVLCGVIVFMTAGFIYIFKKMETKLEQTETALKDYLIAYTRLEARYQELKDDHDRCLRKNNQT